jgi:hypothetical protein
MNKYAGRVVVVLDIMNDEVYDQETGEIFKLRDQSRVIIRSKHFNSRGVLICLNV